MKIELDYVVDSQPRYGYGKPPHPKLYEIINRNRNVYKKYLESFLKYKPYLLEISLTEDLKDPTQPCWVNDFIPGLDAVAIYGLLSELNPQRYFEIGSGNSTRFARCAIRNQKLQTKIVSFDPYPRADIDLICDQIIRQPVEDVDITLFDELEAGDILFVDNSHRIFMNSDSNVVFLDVLPRLKPGVFVEFHDIYLPFDYPIEWKDRYYSEQYLLAAYLLAESDKFEVVLPNIFIAGDEELKSVLTPVWNEPKMSQVQTHGGSFWMKVK